MTSYSYKLSDMKKGSYTLLTCEVPIPSSFTTKVFFLTSSLGI